MINEEERPMKLQPLADKIVAKAAPAEQKTSSGIYIPDTAKEKPVVGEVLAVGKEVKEVKVGDQIVYKEYGPDKVKIGGDELLILKEEDVLAVVKGGK